MLERLKRILAGLSGPRSGDLSPKATFAQLGVDSLLLARFGSRIRQSFGVRLTVRSLMEDTATLDAVTDAIVAASLAENPHGDPGRPPPLPGAVTSGDRDIPLSPGQQEIWLATLRGSDASCAYNLCSTVAFAGPVDEGALGRAVVALVQRHEALRAVPAEDGRTQRIVAEPGTSMEVVELTGDGVRRAEQLEVLLRSEVTTPFDLRNGPLVRAKLIRGTPEGSCLALTVHHMVCDGWSCGVLLRNLGELYASERDDRPADLLPPVQLSDWVMDRDAWSTSPVGTASMDYWTNQFRDLPVPLDLPSAHQRPDTKTFAAREARMAFSVDETRLIREGSRRMETTVFVTLLSGFYALVHGLTGARDLVVGFAVAGQNRYPDQDLVGHCVEFLPLRASMDPGTTFAEHMKAVRVRFFDAMEHQHCTFGELVRRLNPPRDKSRIPLAQVAFNLDTSGRGVSFGDLQATLGAVPREYETMDAFFNVVEAQDGSLDLRCTYNLDLYGEQRVTTWLEALRSMILAAVRDPEQTLGALCSLGTDPR